MKAYIANEMKEKYPSINPNIIRMNLLHEENESFVSGFEGQDDLKEHYNEIYKLSKKYPPRSAKRVKLEGEAALIDAKEELNKLKIEEELNNKVEKYINNHKDEILQDIDRVRKNVDDLGDSKEYAYYALEEHNGEISNSRNSKGLKDLSKDEWNDVKEKAEKMYNEDLKQQKEFEEWVAKRDAKLNQNDQKIGSTKSKKINWQKIDKDNQDPNFDENRYWKNKEKAEKYLDKNYDRIFAETIKDDYDTGGEWGDVDSRYKQYKENPYKFMKDNGRRWIWDYINEAVDKLGLGNVKKLSSSDWDKINAEINDEIKKLTK